MPYKAFPENNQYCVYKLDANDNKTGDSLGCHRTQAEANKQVAALYASEVKEVKMTITHQDGTIWDKVGGDDDETKEAKMVSLPMDITTFAALDDFIEAQGTIAAIEDKTNVFGMLAQNIMAGEEMDKGAALSALAKEYAALVVDETKELAEDDIKAVWTTAYINTLPDSSFLFIEAGGKKDEEGKTVPRSLRHFPYKDADGKVDLPHLRNAIARIPQSTATGLNKTVLQERARRILADAQKELDENKWFDRIFSRVKEAFGIKEEKNQDEFLIWKEADGKYHWLAIYSNNIRDTDNPPEIIASKSHQRFVEMVDKGLYPLPELWLWHVKEWRLGVATGVAYDDAGFSVAIGTIDRHKAAETTAEWLASKENIKVSHGMPPLSIKRDEADNTVIIEHQTREISPLPDFAAANSVTGFSVLKEVSMAIPQHKKEEFVKQGLNPDVLDELEKVNAEAAKETESLEKKEGEVPKQEGGQQETTPEQRGEEPEAVTRQEVAETIAEVVKPLVEQVKALMDEVKELRKEDGEKIAAQAAATPAASLKAMTWETIFGKETQIDGRSSLAKSKPAETQVDEEWFLMDWVKGGK